MSEEIEAGTGTEETPNPTESGSGNEMDELKGTMGQMAQTIASLQATISDLQSKAGEAVEPKAREPVVFDNQGLEDLDRGQFANRLLEATQAAMKQQAEDMQEAIQRLEERVTTDQARLNVEKTADRNKDFWDWKEELQVIARETPNLAVDKAYKLVRAENPEKAKRLDEKYAPKKPEPEKDENLKPTIFGGMKPGGTKTEPTTNMKFSEAAEKAWQETMMDVGDVLNST